jgi:hypothetical protein
MNIFFNLLRILTGLLLTGAFFVLMLIVLLRSTLQFAKESAGVLAYVTRLFTSGFTQGTPPRDPAGWIVSAPQAGLALLFIAMLVSVFLPGTKILLHILAGFTGLALFWYLRMAMTGTQLEVLCLPAIAAWLAYYAMCLFWFRPSA